MRITDIMCVSTIMKTDRLGSVWSEARFCRANWGTKKIVQGSTNARDSDEHALTYGQTASGSIYEQGHRVGLAGLGQDFAAGVLEHGHQHVAAGLAADGDAHEVAVVVKVPAACMVSVYL